MSKATHTPDIPQVFYQSPERADYSHAAVREGADIEFAGPTVPGWYWMPTFGDWHGPFDSEAEAWAPVMRAVNTHDEMRAVLLGFVSVMDEAMSHEARVAALMGVEIRARAALALVEGGSK